MKIQGFATHFTIHDHLPIGLKTNPAHKITAARFGGFVAAYASAMGVENDSAKSTNGSALGIAASTKGTRSAYERNLPVGYETALAVKVSGSAARNSENS
jgi:hypothetical protein